MTQTTMVMGLSLLLLYPSQLLLIGRFGWVMAALLGIAWLSSVWLLPALLAGPLGRITEGIESHFQVNQSLQRPGGVPPEPVTASGLRAAVATQGR